MASPKSASSTSSPGSASPAPATVSAADVASFLRTNPFIRSLNFAFGSLKVYPTGYSVDLAGAFDGGYVKVSHETLPPSVGAQYYPEPDVLAIDPGTDLTIVEHQAIVLHECTHALFDWQKLGPIGAFDNEGAAYVAEALFLEAQKAPPISHHPIRLEAHRIALDILHTGRYWVSGFDNVALATQLRAEPVYAKRTFDPSDGYDPNVFWRLTRVMSK